MAYVLSDEEKSDVLDVAQILGYAKKWEDIHNPYLFLQALTQRSYTNEHHDAENNEILAFYGDRVLEWYVTRMLLNRFAGEGEETPWFLSDFDEDEYTNLKSKLVCRSNLAKIARYYDLGDYLRVGRGSKESETNSDNVLGELVEALIGACALDSSHDYEKKMNYPFTTLFDQYHSNENPPFRILCRLIAIELTMSLAECWTLNDFLMKRKTRNTYIRIPLSKNRTLKIQKAH